MLEAIHHVAIICSDYVHSKRFYAEIVQLPIIQEVWRGERQSWKCDLQVGAAQVGLFSFPLPPARQSRPEACGLRHLAFSVVSLKPVVERLQSQKVAVEQIRVNEHTGKRSVFFADPDGLPLDLYER